MRNGIRWWSLAAVWVSLAAGTFSSSGQATRTIDSPDGKVSVTFALKDGRPAWDVAFAGTTFIQGGRLGIETAPVKFPELKLPLDFLRPGAAYRVNIYADTPGRQRTTHMRLAVSSQTVLTIALEPNGGQVAIIEPW